MIDPDNPNGLVGQPAPLPCHDKLAFDTRTQAEAAAAVAAYQHGAKVRPYICRHCGLWHLSTDYTS